MLAYATVEATTHHHHHELPTSGGALSAVALSATLHCLTGCAIGEVTGMVVGTALGFSDWGTIALAVALAFLFGYTLTSLPLLRAGLALSAVVPIALASDTISIGIMEVVDNGIMLAIPGAMEAGLGDVLFWGALSVALVIAGAFAFPANRWLIARGKGHAAVHETGIHGGPPVRLVGAIAVVAAVFGTSVLIAEAVSDDGGGHGEAAAEHGGGGGAEAAPVRGLATSSDGIALQLDRSELPRGRRQELSIRLTGTDPRRFEVIHEKRLHLIVVRRDMTGFQHLHPTLAPDGTWTTPVELPEAGSYRVFADFKYEGRNQTLATDLAVDGPLDMRPLAAPSETAATAGGYEVRLHAAGREIDFDVRRGGRPVRVEPYLGANGHLVALRSGDLAYLHTHPTSHAGRKISFETEFPSSGDYRLFLQFKHEGKVRTAAFTRRVG
jgi:Domain of unknown function (DUF4396)